MSRIGGIRVCIQHDTENHTEKTNKQRTLKIGEQRIRVMLKKFQ